MACGGGGCCRGADCESRVAGAPVAPALVGEASMAFCRVCCAKLGEGDGADGVCFWCDETRYKSVPCDLKPNWPHWTVNHEGKPIECDCGSPNTAPAPVESDSVCYEVLGEEIGKLVDKKQEAYGDSFGVAGDFMRLLYPDGVRPEQYGDMLALVRVFDKCKRIATDRDALGESPWSDIAGYSLLSLARARAEAK